MSSLRNALLVLFLLYACSCNSNKEDINNIRIQWNKYVESINNNNGPVNVNLIDTSTIQYYEQMLSLIKIADSNTVSLLRTDQKFLVLCIRHCATEEQILSFDGKTLYSFCVQIGLFGGDSFKDNELRSIKIDNKDAYAVVTDTIKDVSLNVYFKKEFDTWKINFTQFYNEHGDNLWEALIKQSEMSETEFLYMVLTAINDRKPQSSIWYPIQ